MKIKDILAGKDFSLSFEVFPPKRDGDVEILYRTIGELKKLKPDFVSVTYGAGGSSKDKTLEIAASIKKNFGLEVLAHITCVQTTKEDTAKILNEFEGEGIKNILALRGDPPKGTERFEKTEDGFFYASELVSFIREHNHFCIGAACYPLGHIESPSLEEDVKNLRKKVDAGTDFLITQLFFENSQFYKFLEMTNKEGINIPIIPGIMPITSYSQIKRMAELSGHEIPKTLKNKLERIADKPEEVEKYGRDYAAMQVMDLKMNKVRGIHFYCMNRSDIVSEILRITEQ
ncbi:Methylenetetrahydrofolate reductase [uncultured archaeon]|nr:Methylenetetrahydrofolate reductase [uncultured archaeon]